MSSHISVKNGSPNKSTFTVLCNFDILNVTSTSLQRARACTGPLWKIPYAPSAHACKTGPFRYIVSTSWLGCTVLSRDIPRLERSKNKMRNSSAIVAYFSKQRYLFLFISLNMQVQYEITKIFSKPPQFFIYNSSYLKVIGQSDLCK